MIQRIQSVWLLLAAIVMAGIFYFPVYKFPDGLPVTIGNNYLAIVLTGLSVILSLLAIFSFRKRKNQKKLVWGNILCCILLLAWLYYSEATASSTAQSLNPGGYFWIGAFLPLISMVLLIMSLRGIQKDEKLIKSMDRLR
ncbi:MAG TPA: DUF4293 domain-containing protein [Edaphocola sp.]|nr:DUF4293 domain-containing protein [Edaphocola sp.]